MLVIEDGGKPITSGLCVSDPLRPKGCVFGDTQCMVDPDFRCDTAGIIYKINCVDCMEEIDDSENDYYVGMTRTTVHARMLGHLKDQKSKLKKSPLYRHDLDRHDGRTQKYMTSIIGRERKLVKDAWTPKGSKVQVEEEPALQT